VVERESYPGYLIPNRVARVKANTAGRIDKVHIQKGDHVRAGDLLVELDDRVSRAQLESARAKLKAAGSKHRATAVAAKAEVDPEDFKIKLRIAEAEVHAAEAAFSSAEHRLADTKVRAPFDGTIMDVLIEKDMRVDSWDPRKAEICELADLNSLLAHVELPENLWRRVRMGQRARVEIPSLSNAPIEGEVLDIDSRVNPSTGCFAVRLKIHFSKGMEILMPGMFALVSLAEDQPEPDRPPNPALPRTQPEKSVPAPVPES